MTSLFSAVRSPKMLALLSAADVRKPARSEFLMMNRWLMPDAPPVTLKPPQLISQSPGSEGALMRYRPKSIAALHIALGGLPDKMRVEADPDIGVPAKTVGELRKVTAWPENWVITTPQGRHPESAVKISKASVATRVSPKR